MDSPTVLAVVDSRIEAELIVGMLRSNGVRATFVTDDAGAQHPHLQIQGIRVLVDPSDEATARQLLAAADDSAGSVDVDAAEQEQHGDRVEDDPDGQQR